MPKLSKADYILKAASLFGFSDIEIEGLRKHLDGSSPNEYIEKRCKSLFDLYKIYDSTEYNEQIDPDDNGIISLDDYAYKVSQRRLRDSLIGKRMDY